MAAPKDPQKYEEWKAKISASKAGKKINGRGHPQSEATRAKISAWQKGRPKPYNVGSTALKGRKLPPEQVEKTAAALRGKKRKPLSEETKAKISKANSVPNPKKSAAKRGSIVSEESRAKISATLQGRKPTPETKANQVAGLRRYLANLTPEQRLDFLERRIGKKKYSNTTIEKYVESQLIEMGFTYVPQKHIGGYSIDFLLPDQNIMIEVNGCFWHCCEVCGFDETYFPNKRQQDRERIAFLESKGYMVIVLWEHDLRPLMKKARAG